MLKDVRERIPREHLLLLWTFVRQQCQANRYVDEWMKSWLEATRGRLSTRLVNVLIELHPPIGDFITKYLFKWFQNPQDRTFTNWTTTTTWQLNQHESTHEKPVIRRPIHWLVTPSALPSPPDLAGSIADESAAEAHSEQALVAFKALPWAFMISWSWSFWLVNGRWKYEPIQNTYETYRLSDQPSRLGYCVLVWNWHLHCFFCFRHQKLSLSLFFLVSFSRTQTTLQVTPTGQSSSTCPQQRQVRFLLQFTT